MINSLWNIVSFLQTYSGAVTAVATVFIATFTVVLACVTNRQAKLTKSIADAALLSTEAAQATVNSMNMTAETQLRAYVLVSAGKVSNFVAGQIPEVEIVIRNTGQTPAYKAVSWIGVNADYYPSKKVLSPPDSPIPMAEAAIPAGGDHHFFVPLNRAIRECEIADIQRGAAAIFAWGEISIF